MQQGVRGKIGTAGDKNAIGRFPGFLVARGKATPRHALGARSVGRDDHHRRSRTGNFNELANHIIQDSTGSAHDLVIGGGFLVTRFRRR